MPQTTTPLLHRLQGKDKIFLGGRPYQANSFNAVAVARQVFPPKDLWDATHVLTSFLSGRNTYRYPSSMVVEFESDNAVERLESRFVPSSNRFRISLSRSNCAPNEDGKFMPQLELQGRVAGAFSYMLSIHHGKDDTYLSVYQATTQADIDRVAKAASAAYSKKLPDDTLARFIDQLRVNRKPGASL